MSKLPSAYMANPPSMPAGGPEMRDYYTNQDPPRPTPHTVPSITPYLGLRARLSQIWINRWTVLLLLVLARTLIGIMGINHDLDSARREALSACSAVEAMGSAMASMPHYMSQGVNEMTASGVEKAVNGLMDMTTLSVTGVEEIVVFVINMMTSTYLCLITLAVSGSFRVALQVIEGAQKSVNDSIQSISSGLVNDVGSFNNLYNNFIKGLGDLGPLTNALSPPSLNLNNTLNNLKLNNVQLPSNLDQGLDRLNASIPTFADVQNFTTNFIRTPFEEVKGLIQQSMTGYTFDRSILPVPQKQQLTFCSDDNGINNFFDELDNLTGLARRIFIGVLITAAILVCVPMAWREIRRYRTMQERAQLVRSSHDPMDVVYIVSRPYTSTAGIKVADKFKSIRHQILVRWVFAYATSTPALFILSLALAGFFSCVCHIILLRALEKQVPGLTNQVSAFADTVIGSLNNASSNWAADTNGIIDATNQKINEEFLGWVNITTTGLNNTLNAFVDNTTQVLNTAFNGTVLNGPIQEVFSCLIGLKVAGIQKAIDWISENAHVDFPKLPNDTFTVGAVASLATDKQLSSDSFLTAPGDKASDSISAAVLRFTTRVEEAIRTEALVATALLLVWVFIVLIAVIRALTLWFGRDKTRGEGGAGNAYVETHERDGFHDIPLGTVTRPESRGPAPKYEFPRPSEDNYEAQKLGFAGQRNYDSSLCREATNRGHSRVSSHAEVWGSDIKR